MRTGVEQRMARRMISGARERSGRIVRLAPHARIAVRIAPRDDTRLAAARAAEAAVRVVERRSASAPRTIAITSGKGGVGKTFVAVNLAVALARRGLRVLVVDADLGLANVDTMLGLHPRATLRQVLAGACTIEDVLLAGPAGITVVPAASGFDDMARLDGRQLERLLACFDDVAARFDVVLIDTGAGISPSVLCFALAADLRLLVSTPEPTALTDAYALLKVLATRYGETRAQVIVNQARSPGEATRTFAHLARVSERFLGFAPQALGHLPFDGEAAVAIRRQQSVLELAPRAAVSRALDTLAAALCAPDADPAPPSVRQPLLEARP